LVGRGGGGDLDQRWRPREEHEEWRNYVALCAASRDTVKMAPVKEELLCADTEDDEESGEDDDQQLGALLAM
jgi:hypothetical protein